MPMNNKEIKAFREQLLALRTQLESAEETGEEAEKTVELDQSRVGRLSRMDAMQGQAMSRETGRRRRLQLRQIEEALKRVEAGDYGDCIECGELINEKRMEANPATPLCISCAELIE